MAAILVIDDDELVRRTTGAMLVSAGHSADLAANGRLGVEKLKLQHYDAVITDILMPDQEGLETVREIRRHDQQLGIVVMSGGHPGSGVDFFAAAMVFGADATLAKPFTRKQLLDCIEMVLRNESARSG